MFVFQHLKFIAGAQQLFHTCSKFAQQEIYQIIDENISARNLELNVILFVSVVVVVVAF